ncbi:hypothetical protein AAG906_022220 [Vitis piasezkii]
MCGSIHQDRYHLTPTLRNFFVKSFLQLHKFVPSPSALERCVDRSTKIDTTYAFVSNSIFALIWFNSFGLMNQGGILVKKFEMSKSPKSGYSSHSFQALGFSFQKNPSSLLFAVIWFDPAVVIENLRRAQLSFSFLSVAGVSMYFGIRSSFSCAKPLLKGHPLEPQKVLEMKIYPSFLLSSLPVSPRLLQKLPLMGFLQCFPQNYVETKTLRQLHLESFLNTPIPYLFVELGWLPLANFIGTVCAPIVRMFYLNIIEHDLDESYLQSSLFGIVVKVTPELITEVLGIPLVQAPSVSDLEITFDLLDKLGSGVHTGSLSRPAWVLATFLSFSVYPSSHRANICKNGCILLSRILHREPINLASCILDEMIFRGDPTVSKKEVLPYGILITKICQRVELYFCQFSFLVPMGPIDTSSWN